MTQLRTTLLNTLMNNLTPLPNFKNGTASLDFIEAPNPYEMQQEIQYLEQALQQLEGNDTATEIA